MMTVNFSIAVDIEEVDELYARDEISERIVSELKTINWVRYITIVNVMEQP